MTLVWAAIAILLAHHQTTPVTAALLTLQKRSGDDCYFDENGQSVCSNCYYPKNCLWDLKPHDSYCDSDTHYIDYTDDYELTNGNDDTSNNSTFYSEQQICDDCYLDEGSEGGCTICYYPKICWGDMHSSYCGYDTDDYTDDGSW